MASTWRVEAMIGRLKSMDRPLSDNQARVSVSILEKKYHIRVHRGAFRLTRFRRFLNLKCARSAIAEKSSAWIVSAVIAALNMANELIRFRNRDSNLDSDVGGRCVSCASA